MKAKIAQDVQSYLLPQKSNADTRYRLICAAIAAAAVSLLVVLARLHPDASGMGTHEQLGWPSCGFLVRTGYPCPTCGMTTAAAYTVRGRIFAALWTQPAGALLTLMVMMLALIGAHAALVGQRLDWLTDQIGFYYWRWGMWLALSVLLSWAWLCLRVYLQPGRF